MAKNDSSKVIPNTKLKPLILKTIFSDLKIN